MQTKMQVQNGTNRNESQKRRAETTGQTRGSKRRAKTMRLVYRPNDRAEKRDLKRRAETTSREEGLETTGQAKRRAKVWAETPGADCRERAKTTG